MTTGGEALFLITWPIVTHRSPPESLNVRESGRLAGWLAGLCVLEKEGAPLGEKEAEAAPVPRTHTFHFPLWSS